MHVEIETKFIEAWNNAFIKSFKWSKVNKLVLNRNFKLGKYKIIAPWHPICFRSDFKKILKQSQFSFLNNNKDVYAMTCIDENAIPLDKKG